MNTSQSGGFYSAEDADSLPTSDAKEKREGAFCVWTWDEVTSLLGMPVKEGYTTTLADVFCHHYSVAEGGNVDPYQASGRIMSGGCERMSDVCCGLRLWMGNSA